MILAVIAFLIYNYCVFYYFAKIFGVDNIKIKVYLLYSAINSFLIYLPIFTTQFQHEWLLMILYFVVIGTEIQLAYKQSVIKTIAALLCFTINYFGTRVVVIGSLALFEGVYINEFINNVNSRLFVTSVVFLVLAPYILLSSQVLIAKVVNYLFVDVENLKLAIVLLGTVCVYQFVNLPTLYSTSENIRFSNWYQMRMGIIALSWFVVIMVVVYIYSMLRKASIIYKDTSAELAIDYKTIQRLESEAKNDYFTGFNIKSVAIEKIEEIIAQKKSGYVIFIDLDGLKFVNDHIGHEEGDWYILNVCDKIREIFKTSVVSRIGGDEFLVVNTFSEDSFVEDSIAKLYCEVIELKNQNNKSYETSISYGVVKFDVDNDLTSEQLIEQADKKMYNFKKSRNKQR